MHGMDFRAKGYWFDTPVSGKKRSLLQLYRARTKELWDSISQRHYGEYDECHFHIGIHKTATTFVQEQLAISNMSHFGVKFYPLEELRSRIYRYGFSSVGRRCSSLNRLLLCNENVLNGTEHLNSGVYADCEQRVGWCIRHIKAKKLVVFINIRNFADFYTSAYCEHLRHFPYQSLEQYLNGVDVTSLSWLDVFEPLFRAHPDIEFRIFNFDFFSRDKERLLSELSFNTVCEYSENLKPSRSAFTEREVAVLSGDSDWIASSRENKFAPFSTETVLAAKSRLEQDIRSLNSRPNVSVINA